MKRKEILPKWIRFFSWIFLMFAIVPIFFVVGLVIEGDYNLTAFGMSYQGSNTLHPMAFYIAALLTLASFVSYGILWGKNWALSVGLIYGSLALLTSLTAMIIPLLNGSFYIGLDPFLLIPFLIILKKKKSEWKDFTFTNSDPKNGIEME